MARVEREQASVGVQVRRENSTIALAILQAVPISTYGPDQLPQLKNLLERLVFEKSMSSGFGTGDGIGPLR